MGNHASNNSRISLLLAMIGAMLLTVQVQDLSGTMTTPTAKSFLVGREEDSKTAAPQSPQHHHQVDSGDAIIRAFTEVKVAAPDNESGKEVVTATSQQHALVSDKNENNNATERIQRESAPSPVSASDHTFESLKQSGSGNTTATESPPKPPPSESKPTFYLHVGPPKTSSTTIQAHLTAWRHVLEEKDNTIYLGRFFDENGKFFTNPNTTSVVRAVSNVGCYFSAYEAWKNVSTTAAAATTIPPRYPECFEKMLHDVSTFQTGHPTSHVILSDEVLMAKRHLLDNLYIFDFLQHTLFTNYTLQIVTTYRRSEDWYPSARKQINLRSQKRNVWQGYVWPLFPHALYNARRHTHRILPTPWETIWKLRQSNVSHAVYNLHDNTRPMIQSWLCDILNATHSCAMAKHQNTTTELRLNSEDQRNIELWYDEVVSWAHHHEGLLQTTRRKTAIHVAMRYDLNHQRNHFDLPMACPSQQQYEEYYNIRDKSK